jgi:urease accessory protein
MKTRSFLTAAALAATTVPALAHPGHDGAGLVSGLLHPLSGADHVLAMVAVGVWAAYLGGRSLWAVPASFVLAMIAGFILGAAGMVAPAIEPGVAASVFVLGVMIATAARLPLLPSMAMVGLFGFFHGQAHGSEITGAALTFALGFTLSTIFLHATGLALGGALVRQRLPLARALGALIAGVGVFVLGGVA